MSMRQLSEQDRFYGTDRNHFHLVRENAVILFQEDIERKFQLEPAHVREVHYSYASSYLERDEIHSANCDIDHGRLFSRSVGSLDTTGYTTALYREALLSWWHSDIRADMVESVQRKRLHSNNSPSPSRFDSQSKCRKLDFDQVSEITPLTPRSDVDDFIFSESESEDEVVRGTKRSRSEEANVDRLIDRCSECLSNSIVLHIAIINKRKIGPHQADQQRWLHGERRFVESGTGD